MLPLHYSPLLSLRCWRRIQINRLNFRMGVYLLLALVSRKIAKIKPNQLITATFGSRNAIASNPQKCD